MSDYSLWADMLNKFHTSVPWIQLIWLVVIPLLFFGILWCIKEVFLAFIRNRTGEHVKLIYTIYRDDKNELLVYKHFHGPDYIVTRYEYEYWE